VTEPGATNGAAGRIRRAGVKLVSYRLGGSNTMTSPCECGSVRAALHQARMAPQPPELTKELGSPRPGTWIKSRGQDPLRQRWKGAAP
jgi:hypothetical protein